MLVSGSLAEIVDPACLIRKSAAALLCQIKGGKGVRGSGATGSPAGAGAMVL